MLPDKCNISTIHSLEIIRSTLEIPNASAEDAGIYLCIVRHARGKTPELATATLHISGTYMLSFIYHGLCRFIGADSLTDKLINKLILKSKVLLY